MRLDLRWQLMPFVVVLTLTGQAEADVLLNIQGLAQADTSTPNTIPPDVTGAAGPSDIAEFVTGAFATFSKSGVREATVSDTQFWSLAGIAASDLSPGVSRPRLLYDPNSSRWYAAEITNASSDNRVLLAVSTGSNPSPAAGNWKAVSFRGDPASPSDFTTVDYPNLGIDANGVYVTTQGFNEFDPNIDSFYTIPKTSLLALGGPSLAGMTATYGTLFNEGTYGLFPQPTVNFAPSADREVVMATSGQSVGNYTRTDITMGVGGATLSAVPQEISGQTYGPTTSPRQPDGSGGINSDGGVESFDDRFSATIYRVGNLVYAVHAAGLLADPKNQLSLTDHTAIRWEVFRLNADGTTTLAHEGTIDNPAYDYFQPSIAANSRGDVVIGFNRSGPHTDGSINAFYAIGTTDSSGGVSFAAPQAATDLTSVSYHYRLTWPPNGSDPWGEHGALAPDPNNPSLFWSFQEVPNTSNASVTAGGTPASDTWATQITEIQVPEPTSLGLVVVAAGLVRRKIRRRS